MLNIIQKYIQNSSLRRSGQKILGVKFIVAHDTGNDRSTALQNVDYYIKSCNETEASAHAFVDDLGVIECIPATEKAWHVRRNVTTDNQMFGVDANDYSLGIELCFFSDDIPRSLKAYNNYVEYIASLCTKYSLQPSQHLVGHYTLDPTRRTDPLNAFKHINKTWDGFIKDLQASMTPVPAIIDNKEEIKKAIAILQKLI